MTRPSPLLAVVGLGLLLVACGKDETSTGSNSAPDTNAIVLDEWSVTPPADLTSGKVRITATNQGSEPHELVIVRSTESDPLPTKQDGSVDEDKIPEADKFGEIPEFAPGTSATKSFDLPAGDYTAFCNVVDQMGMGNGSMGNGSMGNGSVGNGSMEHVHYALGMVTTFTVA